MKLVEALQVVRTTSGQVTVVNGYDSGSEITKRSYQFRMHHKDLLDREVKTICQQDGEMYIVLCNENSLQPTLTK